MSNFVKMAKEHYTGTFKKHGPTSQGVNWGADEEVQTRYRKMMEVLNHDYEKPAGRPSILDVGCGWGGLLRYCDKNCINVDYTGIDLVQEMIEYARNTYDEGKFFEANILDYNPKMRFDYVVGNGLLVLRKGESIVKTEIFIKKIIKKMYKLCNYGIAFNLMSNRVNYMADLLHYTSPSEILTFCLTELSHRVRMDHQYICLYRSEGKLYEYTICIYKNNEQVGKRL